MLDRTGRPVKRVLEDLHKPPVVHATLKQKFKVYVWAFKKIIKANFNELSLAYRTDLLDKALPRHCVDLSTSLYKITNTKENHEL